MRTSEGTVHAVTLSLASGSEDLERVRARDCAQQALRRAVRLSLEGWVLEGEVLRGALVLTRARTREAVAVEGFGGDVIYTIRAATAATSPLVTLAPGQREATLPVRVEATRCDAHALAESKQSHVFRLYLTVGGRPAELTTVRADAAGIALLDQLAARTCVPGG